MPFFMPFTTFNFNHTENAMITTQAPHDDLVENPSPRCPIALVIDTSGSMSGDPITELNAGVQLFIDETKRDDLARWSVELAVWTAGGSVDQLCDFTGIEHIDGVTQMNASGDTPLGEAVQQAVSALNARKAEYRNAGVPYYQPWLVIISDGVPTDNWQDIAQYTCQLAKENKLVSLPVGVSGANLMVLGQFSNKPAIPLKGIAFREFFSWLSASMARVSASTSSDAQVSLPNLGTWADIGR